MEQKGKFNDWKKRLAIVSGILIFLISAFNSKNGFVGDTQGDWLLASMGWAFAVAATSAEFMFTSDFRKLNWSIIFLGLCAYVYSIYTNILGLQAWRGSLMQYDMVNVIGGVFMDVYPEAAIAWALNESRLGDVIGNLIKTSKRGDELTDTGPRKVHEQPRQPVYPVSIQTKSALPRPIARTQPVQPEPTYHPVGLPPRDLEDFLKEG